MTRSYLPLPLVPLAMLVVVSACDILAPAPVPQALALAAGEEQQVAVGSAVPARPAVRVENEDGSPVAAILVEFVVTAGGGSVTPPFALTDRSGVAEVRNWRLGPRAGLNTLEARVGDLPPVIYRAMATAGPPAAMDLYAGKGQTGEVGQPLPVPPAVILRDRFNNAVSGHTVRFEVAAGGGAVTGGEVTSDAEGVAEVGAWTLGTTAAPQRLIARASDLPEVPVDAAAEPGPPGVLTPVAGHDQTAVVGTAVPVPPAVVVTDAFGNPIDRVSVTFEPGSGGGSITGGTQPTDETGRATLGSWTLGTVAGPQTVAVAVGDVEPLIITAMAEPDAPAILSGHAGDGQTATVAAAVADPPTVRVTDQYGNPVAGVDVTFAVESGGGSLTAPIGSTDADGLARVGSWVLGTTAGTNTLTATVSGAGSASFTAIGTPGPAATMEVRAGDKQVAPPSTAVEIPPAVLVLDEHGNGVAGIPVTFTVSAGGGTVTEASPTTDATGVATVGSWILGPEATPQALTATSPGLPDVVFTATVGQAL